MAALVGVTAATASTAFDHALAEVSEMTIANFGGSDIVGQGEAFGEPFTKDTGVKINIDGSGPLVGRIRKVVDDGNNMWDIIDAGDYFGQRLGPDYLLPIDYSVVNPEGIFEWLRFPYVAGNYLFSIVNAYDSSKVPEAPTSWADFFDLKKFPGKRAIYKWFDGTGEIFMLAAGKKKEEVYPFDMDLIFEMLGNLGDNVIFWDTGGVSRQLLVDQEVVMANIWSPTAVELERDTKSRVTWTWNQHIMKAGGWAIPKGCRDVDLAQKFIASCHAPERQIRYLELTGNGPANPAVLPLLTEEQKRINPVSHMDVAFLQNVEWYATQHEAALFTWLDHIGN